MSFLLPTSKSDRKDRRPLAARCALAQSSPNLTWADIWLRADSARPQRASGFATRVLIAAHVKFGDDCANK